MKPGDLVYVNAMFGWLDLALRTYVELAIGNVGFIVEVGLKFRKNLPASRIWVAGRLFYVSANGVRKA